MYGPEFLKSHRSEWKFDAQQSYDVPLSHPEVMRSLYSYDCNVNPLHLMDCIINFYSHWERLLKGVVWLLKIRAKLLKKEVSMVLLLSDIEGVENLIIRHVQMRCYPEELIRLLRHESVPYDSKLRKLSPCVNDDEIIVVSGHLKHANTSDRSKEPYIVPHSSAIGTFIVRSIHNKVHHFTEWTLSDVRQKYWITHGRVVVKKVIHACITCKRLLGNPVQQKMADLPPERIQSGKPAFTYVGTDCFGPYHVKYRRGEILRYAIRLLIYLLLYKSDTSRGA